MIVDEFKGKKLWYDRYQVVCSCGTKIMFDYVNVKKHKVTTKLSIKCPYCRVNIAKPLWKLITKNSCTDEL